MSNPRAKTLFAQIAHLLTSRTRQRDVLGPGWIMLFMGVIVALDALFGLAMPRTVVVLLVVLLSVWAGLIAWQHEQTTGERTFFPAAGFLLLGGLGIMLGMNLQLPWGLLLAALALRLLFAPAARN